MGRLAHGRLIIPGYDKVFVAPLLAMLACLTIISLPYWTGISERFAIPGALTISWWIIYGMGPSLDAWRLTGNHRIVKGVLMTAGQESR